MKRLFLIWLRRLFLALGAVTVAGALAALVITCPGGWGLGLCIVVGLAGILWAIGSDPEDF